jgi:hypothetical protein
LGQRSRKRGQRSEPAPTASDEPSRSEGAERAASTGPAAPSQPSRTERRNTEARAQLEPLAPGERPGAVTVAAIVAVGLAGLVVVGYLTGAHVGGHATLARTILLAGIFLLAAAGMWRARYWAVLGFEALLAFQVIVAALSLLVASNLWAAALCLLVMGLGGWLFWKLIRAMARIQMPERKASP